MPHRPIHEIIARWSVPVLLPAAIFWSYFAGPDPFYFWVTSHTSVLELAVGAVLIVAIILGAMTILNPQAREHRHLIPWLIAWCLGLTYFAGEDLNWGQYIFGWDTPEALAAINKENETNLHNIDPIFNQRPRQVVQLWVLIAGVLVAMNWWKWPRRATAKFVPDVLWPGRGTVLLAALTTLVPVFEKIVEAIWGPEILSVGIRPSEIQEVFFAWFMLLYMFDLRGRLRKGSQPAGQPAD